MIASIASCFPELVSQCKSRTVAMGAHARQRRTAQRMFEMSARHMTHLVVAVADACRKAYPTSTCTASCRARTMATGTTAQPRRKHVSKLVTMSMLL